jgi:hypothetical protein
VALRYAGRSSASSWALVALSLAALAQPSRAAAQGTPSAWLPVQGEGSVSFTFQTLDFGGHFDEGGNRLEGVAGSRAYVGIFQFEYGLTDRLALTARLPYIASRFTGSHHEPIMVLIHDRYEEYRRTHPEAPADTSLDTGNYYATFQDFGFTLRYNILNRRLTVTPVIGATIPSHHYRTIGEAGPGQDRLALHTGVNVARLLDPLLPNGYIHGRYTYSFVQRFRGIPLDRSTAELEVGYAVTPTVGVRALANWMKTHGGIGFWEAYEDLSLFLAHDRLLAGRYWHVGGAATVSLTDSVDLDGAVVSLVAGADTHYGIGVNVGLTWRFLTPRARQP